MKTTNSYERVFIKTIEERVDSKGMSHSDFGRRAFGAASGVRLWRKMRSPEEHRTVTLEDALRMAEALGEDFASFIWNVSNEARKEGIIK